MNKLKELKALVQASDSYRWAKRALFLLLAFKALEYIYGMALVLAVFVAAAAIAPVLIKRVRQDRIREDRNHALTAVKNLHEQANRERKWSVRGSAEDDAKAIRFAFAQRKANKVHRDLDLRIKHLDRCMNEGIASHPGADWNAITTVANRVIDMLDSAQWLCTNGLAPETGLLDPTWTPDICIHSEITLEDEGTIYANVKAAEARERVVVEMGDFSSLRKHKVRPYGEAEVFEFGQDQRSNDNR